LIKKLRLENFQGFGKNTEIELAPITLIFGPNSSGKSSLIKSLLLMKQSVLRPLENSQVNFIDSYVDVGDFSTCVFAHDKLRKISLGATFLTKSQAFDLDFEISDPGHISKISMGISSTTVNQGELNFQLKFVSGDEKQNDFGLYRPSVESLNEVASYGPGSVHKNYKKEQSRSTYDRIAKAVRGSKWAITPGFRLEPNSNLETTLQQAFFKQNRGQGKKVPMPSSFLVFYGISSAIDIPRRTFKELMQNTAHIAGLRQIPKRFSQIGNNSRQVESDASNISEFLAANPKSTELTSRWLAKLTNKAYSLEYLPIEGKVEGLYSKIGALVLHDKKSGTQTTFQDVGLGLSQVLPILSILAQNKSKKSGTQATDLLLLEQPELHLHPQMQADLMEIIAKESAAIRESGPQIIMETHSENMLLSVQRLIRTKVLSSSKVSILYVDRKSGSRTSSVTKLRLSESGEFLDPWPLGFGEVRLNQVL
jgi:AAA15 family ATPase/GTPase